MAELTTLRSEGRAMLEDASNFLVVLAADIKEQTMVLDSAIDDLQDAAEEETITVSKWAVLDDADDLLANAKRAAAKLEDIQTALKVAQISEEKEKREADEAEAQLKAVKAPYSALPCPFYQP